MTYVNGKSSLNSSSFTGGHDIFSIVQHRGCKWKILGRDWHRALKWFKLYLKLFIDYNFFFCLIDPSSKASEKALAATIARNN